MRRKEREVVEASEIMEIIQKCDCCSIAFSDGEYPYVIPLNFGAVYRNDTFYLYFHCAHEGKKIDLIHQNNKVAFEMNTSHKLILSETACNATMGYESVCGTGTIRIVDGDRKAEGLQLMMKQYDPDKIHEFPEKALQAVTVLEMEIKQISGKRNLR